MHVRILQPFKIEALVLATGVILCCDKPGMLLPRLETTIGGKLSRFLSYCADRETLSSCFLFSFIICHHGWLSREFARRYHR